MNRLNQIELQRVGNGVLKMFDISHAERILKMKNSGWSLPKNSTFTFDPKNGIKPKRNKKSTEETE